VILQRGCGEVPENPSDYVKAQELPAGKEAICGMHA
jgi:hypothetical protein